MLRSLVVLLTLSSAAVAQAAPSASEIASYKGLHLAAHEGQVVEINRLIAQGRGQGISISDHVRQR